MNKLIGRKVRVVETGLEPVFGAGPLDDGYQDKVGTIKGVGKRGEWAELSIKIPKHTGLVPVYCEEVLYLNNKPVRLQSL